MVLLSSKVKQELFKRIRAKQSINVIHQEMSLSKGTIYYHYKKIYGRKNSKQSIPLEYSERTGEIVGIFVGDGSMGVYKNGNYSGYICFSTKAIKYAKYVQNLFSRFFKKQLILYETGHVYRLKLQGKHIYEFFKEYVHYKNPQKALSVHLKTIQHSNPFIRGFLKGLLDTDGTLYITPTGNPRIEYSTSSPKLKEQLVVLLTKQGYTNRVRELDREKYKLSNIVKSEVNNINYQVCLRTKKESERFLEYILPFKIERWGGRDSNSRSYGPQP